MATFRQRLGAAIAGRAPTEKKESATTAVVVATGNYSARWTQVDYASMAREGYGRNPYVYASIRQISMALAGIKWSVYSDRQKTQEYEDHPLRTLIDNPNPRQARTKFFENVVGFLMLDGNVFIERAGPNNKPPIELYAHRPDRVQIIVGNANNPIGGYQYSVGNASMKFPPEMIRHLKFFNPLDDWRGMSPMQAALMSVSQSNASKTWNVALLQNGAKPPGALKVATALDDEQFRKLQAMIDQDYSGSMNAGRPLLLEGGMEWQEMGMTPQDMAWLEGQRLSAREIAIVYNIAPELIGDASNKTYSNFKEARSALYTENVLPLSDWIRDEFNAWLSPLYSDTPYIDYVKDDIEALREDQNAVWDRADKAFTSGWITINDARKLAGQPEDPKKGDQYVWEAKAAPAPPDPSLGLTGKVVEGSTGDPKLLGDGSTSSKNPGGSVEDGSSNGKDTTDGNSPSGGAQDASSGGEGTKIRPFPSGRSQRQPTEQVS